MPDTEKHPTRHERDEPVRIDLDPDDALRALMETGPHPEPVEKDPEPPQGDPLQGADSK
ncbi:MAG TPA: hypothetical protein VKG38_04240 [Solirubrobacteraceae bacterium]|nr:hypothetical protein [Solirubrobacteraceae bacterium]